MELLSEQAMRYVWEGAIPLQIFLHESEVTTLPPPPPVMILGPRLGYLPLLVPTIKPYFNETLPPGVDSVWFDYKGLPLKWNIPTGVLFDLLCAEPERPWNLTVHFRAPPGDILIPCDGEDSVKWSFINSLKEADQSELWQSLIKGNMDGYARVSSRLKIGPFGDDAAKPTSGNESTGTARSSRIPVRLYLRVLGDDEDDLEDVTAIDSWDSVSYINRPVEIHREEGHYVTFKSAMRSLLPDLFVDKGDEIDALKDDVETTGIVESTFSSEENKCLDLEAMKPNSPKKAYQINSSKSEIKNAIKTLRRRWEGERYGFGGEGRLQGDQREGRQESPEGNQGGGYGFGGEGRLQGDQREGRQESPEGNQGGGLSVSQYLCYSSVMVLIP
ncbi:hypothetical protein HPP92_002242 [Vanilla planifolia]|uniref:Autophagy protein 5 n=1 Tax=Vanilla planifolia TaxID=51239 RepID=A0A835S871_VANPL|nr:hypothetical protein HPP92_002242 [Vanilla planifolia]